MPPQLNRNQVVVTQEELHDLVSKLQILEARVAETDKTAKATSLKHHRVPAPVFAENSDLQTYRDLVKIWEASAYVQGIQAEERARILLSIIDSELQVKLFTLVDQKKLVQKGTRPNNRYKSLSVDYWLEFLNDRYGLPEVEIADGVFREFEQFQVQDGEDIRTVLNRWAPISTKMTRVDSADICMLRLQRILGLSKEAQVSIRTSAQLVLSMKSEEERNNPAVKLSVMEQEIVKLLGSEKPNTTTASDITPAVSSDTFNTQQMWLPTAMTTWESDGKTYCQLPTGKTRECVPDGKEANVFTVQHRFHGKKAKGKGKGGKGKGKGKGTGRDAQGRPICFKCGSPDHFASACPVASGQQSTAQNHRHQHSHTTSKKIQMSYGVSPQWEPADWDGE